MAVTTLCDNADLGYCRSHNLCNGWDVCWANDAQMTAFCNNDPCSALWKYTNGQLLQMSYPSVADVSFCSQTDTFDTCGQRLLVGGASSNGSDPQCSQYNGFYSWINSYCTVELVPAAGRNSMSYDECPCTTTVSNLSLQYTPDSAERSLYRDIIWNDGLANARTAPASVTVPYQLALVGRPQCTAQNTYDPASAPVQYVPLLNYITNIEGNPGAGAGMIQPLYMPNGMVDARCLCAEPVASLTVGKITPGAGVLWTDPGFQQDVCNAMIGTLLECPSQQGDARSCQFRVLARNSISESDTPTGLPYTYVSSGSTPGKANTAGYNWGYAVDAVQCTKVKFDDLFLVPCCLDMLPGATLTDPHLVEAYRRERLCDPSWCTGDPAGQCAASQEFITFCGSLALDINGALTPLIALDGHPCQTWYQNLLENPLSGKWAAADQIVRNVCGANPGIPACQCMVMEAPATCQSGPDSCFLYSSVTDPSGADCPTNAQQVQIGASVGDGMFRPINLTDAVCLNPNCQKLEGVVMTGDMLRRTQMCPDVCMQTLEDTCVSAGTIIAGGGIYIDNKYQQCSAGAVTKTAPVPWMPASWVVPAPYNPNDPSVSFPGQPIVVANTGGMGQDGAMPFAPNLGLTYNPGDLLTLDQGSLSVAAGDEAIVNVNFTPGVTAAQVYAQGPFITTLTAADPASKLQVQTVLYVNPFLTNLHDPPLCAYPPCWTPNPGSENNVTTEDDIDSSAWTNLSIAGIVLLVIIGMILYRSIRM